MKAEKRTFVFHLDWAAVLNGQPDKIRLAVYDAIVAYVENGTLPKDGTPVYLVFLFIKQQIDKDAERYAEICEKRRNSGSKGGKQKAENATKCYQMLPNATKSKQVNPDNDSDNDSDSDNNINIKNINNDIKQSNRRFTPPTVDEVQKYCRERENNIDAAAFVSFYESNGWKVGQNKMKDWKAAVRTWEQRHKNDRPVRKIDTSEKDNRAVADIWN